MIRLAVLILVAVLHIGDRWFVQDARFSSVWYEVPRELVDPKVHRGALLRFLERCLDDEHKPCVRHLT